MLKNRRQFDDAVQFPSRVITLSGATLDTAESKPTPAASAVPSRAVDGGRYPF
jgi:hypothetical protein